MKIACIGSRGYPASYASAEDMVREFGPRFVRDGDTFVVHCWETPESKANGNRSDSHNGLQRVFHSTREGKISGQFIIALKSSIHAALSDCDLVFYIFVNSAIFSWIPKLMGKRVFVNVDGIMWKDPKWPWGIRHAFFPLASYLSYLVADKIITDSRHMKEIYRKKFHIDIDWVGYGCAAEPSIANELPERYRREAGYYLIMSRITPHNLTDIMVDGFLLSGSKSHLFIAGHTPKTKWFTAMKHRTDGTNVTFLGLVRDQDELSRLIVHARAYLHGHSLGGINPALVRVTGIGTPAICVDTIFNREIVEDTVNSLHATMFEKNAESVAKAIRSFEETESERRNQSVALAAAVRKSMSWEVIYQEYKRLFRECMAH